MMKLSQLISKYHAVHFSIRERNLEDDPLGVEADDLLARIERTPIQDVDDVAALARFAKHLIENEDDAIGAVPLIQAIANWAGFLNGKDYEQIVSLALRGAPLKN